MPVAFFRMPALRLALFLLPLALPLAGCGGPRSVMPLGQTSFAQYQEEAAHWITAHREFQTANFALELGWNLPCEWRPEGQAHKGILLVHGLGDSPWTFSDLGPELARQGLVARAILLPGCGTRPEDMIDVSVDDWRRVVDEQAAILAAEVDELYLGGFSTGGNLVLEYAVRHPKVAGLALFSPAFRSNETFDFLAPLAALFTDWLIEPDEARPAQLPQRYAVVPTNAFAQFYYTSASALRLLRTEGYARPVLIVLAEHDSVVDTQYILERFDESFPHPQSRLIWYGRLEPGQAFSPRVLEHPDHRPEWRISQFSHMGIVFKPDNSVFGLDGIQRVCWNGDLDEYEKCLAGAEIWYADYGYQETGKIHARLTFNPDFAWQSGIMRAVLAAP